MELLARLRLFHFDFESGQSQDEAQAIAACRELAPSGSLADGKKLWDRLVGLAGEGRSVGGYFDLPNLIRSLRGVVELQEFPDFREDWRAIKQRSDFNIGEVRAVVGDNVHLDRSEARQMVGDAIRGNACVAVVGNSGTGKSGIVVDVIRTLGTFRRVDGSTPYDSASQANWTCHDIWGCATVSRTMGGKVGGTCRPCEFFCVFSFH